MLRDLRVAVAPLVWGTTYLTTTDLLPPHRPLLAATARALPAGLLLVAVTRALPPRGWWWRSAVLGGCNIAGFFALLFVTAQRLPGGVAAVLTASQALLVAVLAGPVLAQRVSRGQATAVALGLVGVATVVLTPAARLDGLGVVAGFGAAACTAAGVLLTRRWGRPPGAGLLAATGWQLTAGGVLLLPPLAAEGLPDGLAGRAWLGLAWLVLPGTALAYVLWFDGVERLPAVAVSSLALLAPVTAAVLGWAVAHQRLTPLQLGGGALVLGAVLALQGVRLPRQAARLARQRGERRGQRPSAGRTSTPAMPAAAAAASPSSLSS